jgi:hypothetical protein
MTFGEIKSIIETNLVQSYKNEGEFKKLLKEFRHYVLTDKKISKLYALYDQLSSPQGLNEEEAKEYLSEGISLIQQILPEIKLPRTQGKTENYYKTIDALVYNRSVDIKERVESKKQVIKTLMEQNIKNSEFVNLPIESMVKVANSTINSYLNKLDEGSKKEVLSLLSDDTNVLKENFNTTRKEALSKLNTILSTESDFETKTKISETIERIETTEFDHLNFLKLKSLVRSL